MRGVTGTSRAPANVPPAVAGACPPWVLDAVARAYERDPRPALGALLERLRRETTVRSARWDITEAGRRALDEDV